MEEITAEFAVQEIAPSKTLRFVPKVSIGCKTDIGRIRENNEDKYEFFIPELESELATKGLVFVVCDGMGGHEAGQIASELATKTFLDVYRSHPSDDPGVAIRAAIGAANRYVLDVGTAIPSRRGMGTTLSALVMIQDKAYIGHVGDSRIYRRRDGETVQLTQDHTYMEEMIRLGMDRAQAEANVNRHAIMRAVGVEADINPDIFGFDLKPGDQFLLCSDGVTNHVTDYGIADVLSSGGPSDAAWKAVSSALIGGGSDNATVIVVRVDSLHEVSSSED